MQFKDLVTKDDLLALENRIAHLLQHHIPEGFTPGQQWLRSRDVTKWLGISSSTLQNMRDSQSIPFTRIGETYLYPYGEVVKILEGRMQPPPKQVATASNSHN
ncbi:MAG: helix-turn-helix domain-containing protein [Bacteroidota bacterium]